MKQQNEMETIGLAFFGRVSASISHEIKNTLAIINENAGLLEDLALLAEKGVPLSHERLLGLSESIKRQVNRADTSVKNMNRFSHSTDQRVQSVDIYETAVFVTALCSRQIGMHNITVNVEPPAVPVIISSSLFYLEYLIWACIDFMINDEGVQHRVALTIEKSAGGAQIRLRGLGALKPSGKEILSQADEKTLQGVLQADIRVDAPNGEILLILPEKIH